MTKENFDINKESEEYNIEDIDSGEYVLPEADENSGDSGGEEGEEEGPSGRPKRRARHPMLMFLRMFISPLKAWKALKNSAVSSDDFARRCFYPLIALVTACNFLRLLREPDLTLSSELQNAVVIFISFFLGYFVVLFLAKICLPNDANVKVDTPFGRIWLMSGLGTLVVFLTLDELLPDLDAILVFLPLFTIYLMVRGARFLRLKRASEAVVGWIAALLCIFVPYGIYELFSALLPG